MHQTLSNIDETLSSENVTIQETPIGELHLSVEAYETDLDTAPLFEGLPNDRCPCPHWGYMLSGQIHVEYKSDEESIAAGEVFYLPPGHTVEIEAGTEYLTFSPTEEFRAMMEVVATNVRKMR